MDIDFLRAGRDREEQARREKIETWIFRIIAAPFTLIAWVMVYLYERLFGKTFCLFIECTEEQVLAVRISLKTALGLSYDEFQRFEKRIPGPIFWGSREALDWLAKGLQKQNVPCRVCRVVKKVTDGIEWFGYPDAHNLPISEAYKDSYVEYERYLDWKEGRLMG